MHRLANISAFMVLSWSTACATTGATLGSGVGDAYLEHPPYYAGVPMEGVRGDSSPIAHLAVAYQRAGPDSRRDTRTTRYFNCQKTNANQRKSERIHADLKSTDNKKMIPRRRLVPR
jgi:hypothetical protein